MKRNNLAVVSLIFLCMNFQCIKNINHDTNDVIITEFSLNSKFTDGNIYHFDVLKKIPVSKKVVSTNETSSFKYDEVLLCIDKKLCDFYSDKIKVFKQPINLEKFDTYKNKYNHPYFQDVLELGFDPQNVPLIIYTKPFYKSTGTEISRSYPTFDITVKNTVNRPIIINGISMEVIDFIPCHCMEESDFIKIENSLIITFKNVKSFYFKKITDINIDINNSKKITVTCVPELENQKTFGNGGFIIGKIRIHYEDNKYIDSEKFFYYLIY